MLIKPLSDIHNEFQQFYIPEASTDKDTVLVLAGDIGVVDKIGTISATLLQASTQFKHVLYVLGNHEYYAGFLQTTLRQVKDHILDLGLTNVTVLEKTAIEIDGVVFLGATMWTDYDDKNPLTMYNAQSSLNDFNLIRSLHKSEVAMVKPYEFYDIHIKTRKWLVTNIRKFKKQGKKVVVVTHHAPCKKSISPEYMGSVLNGAFCTEMSEMILTYNPDMWIHGHLHSSSDYLIGDCRIIANPRGYATHALNPTFDSSLLLSV